MADIGTEEMGLSHEMSSEVSAVSKMQDEGRLAELGYTQELQRDWGFLHNAGASFSIIVSGSSLCPRFDRGNVLCGPITIMRISPSLQVKL